MVEEANSSVVLLVAVALLALVAAMLLACGPAAPQDANESAGIQAPPTQVAPQDDPAEDATPYPTKPPSAPTITPYPTLIPDSPNVLEEEAALLAAERAARAASDPPLVDQITQFTRDKLDLQYNAIVRAKVKSHRVVPPNLEYDWPNESGFPPYIADGQGGIMSWRRTALEITETYHGSLPDTYDVLSPSLLTNMGLDIDKEYILYILPGWVAETEFTDRPGKTHMNAEQLEAFGGTGGLIRTDHTWIIDGDKAWRVPGGDLMKTQAAPDLAAAKAAGEGLPVAELLAAINMGIKK